jgi:acylphosphatase
MNKIRAEVYISGKVQGVFFRYFVKTKALFQKVSGYVENLKDGSVHAVFEGDKQKVAKMIKICEQGPPTSKVEDVNVIYSQKLENLKSFKIIGLGLFGR